MSNVKKATALCKWVLAMPFALLVAGPGILFLFFNVIRMVFPDFMDIKVVVIATCLQFAICFWVSLLILRKKIVKPLLVAMSLAAVISNLTCSAFACLFAYNEYQRTAPYRKLIGPLGGPDLLMPKPDADVESVEIGLLRGHRTEEDAPPPLLVCTNGVAVQCLLVVLNKGRKVEDHKCSSEGVIYLHSKTGSFEKVEFLSGHSYRHYEFRHGGGIYRMSKSDFFSALSGLGFDTRSLRSPSREGQ